MVCLLIRRSCFALLLSCGAALAQGKAPAPEFAVEMNFQAMFARVLADGCETLEFDHAGFDRHMRALLGAYSDRGTNARHYAPIQQHRYDPHFDAFRDKYELTADSADADYCTAGEAEADWRTPLGQLLRKRPA